MPQFPPRHEKPLFVEATEEAPERALEKRPKPKRVRLGKEEKELQAVAMVARRALLGETIADLCAQFGVSAPTVASRLALGRTLDLHELARDIIAERLLPKAIAVYDRELSEGNVDVAKDVLFGTGALRKDSKSEIHHISSTPTLDMIRQEHQSRARVAIEGTFTEASEGKEEDK